MENADLKRQIQDKVYVITSLKNDLRKLKGKETVENVAQIPIATIIAPCMFKIDLEPLAPRLLNNREAHIDYLKHTQEQADILRGIVEQAKAKQLLDNALDFACKHAKQIQELLVYVRDTCPNAFKPSEKMIAVTPMNKIKKVRFSEPPISSSNIKQVESLKTPNSNTPVLSSTRLKCSTSTCRSQPTDNKKNDRISQKPSSNKKNKVEAQPMKVNKKNRVKEPICKTPKPKIKVYSRRPKQIKSVGSSKKAKIVESKIANNSEPNHLWGSNATDVPSSSSLVNDRLSRLFFGTVRFRNDQIAKIMGYGDYQLGNVIISRKNTCFIRNLEGVDLLSGSRDTNLYTISLDDMLKTCMICLLSKASKTKSWLLHRQLSHLNFGTLNKLAKDGLARGIPKLKFQKDHLRSACALGKIKKSSYQPKAEDTNKERLYLLQMDLYGSMRVESINEKKYILVIVDDYSQFTWVRFLRSKDEAPNAIIKCIKNIQVRWNATICNVRIDNGTEFVNQTLRDFYENVGILHQTFVARTPQQNGIV
ncbi:retrovirus-related pol polyprotein from transposon TNT 1-94 [Tanacetum coccineum]